ncbi:hypothetical protein J6W34_03090 [bacterium]|nr:hypothetical protein [bacterium]
MIFIDASFKFEAFATITLNVVVEVKFDTSYVFCDVVFKGLDQVPSFVCISQK